MPQVGLEYRYGLGLSNPRQTCTCHNENELVSYSEIQTPLEMRSLALSLFFWPSSPPTVVLYGLENMKKDK